MLGRKNFNFSPCKEIYPSYLSSERIWALLRSASVVKEVTSSLSELIV
jgi:hypothetical protein